MIKIIIAFYNLEHLKCKIHLHKVQKHPELGFQFVDVVLIFYL